MVIGARFCHLAPPAVQPLRRHAVRIESLPESQVAGLMSDSFAAFLTHIRNALGFAPDWAVAAILIVIAVTLAMLTHRVAVVVLRRRAANKPSLSDAHHRRDPGAEPAGAGAVRAGHHIPVAPVYGDAFRVLSRLVWLATIGLLGWIAIAAIHIAADLYLLQFRIDVADNLLARKHITQIRILRRATDTLVIVITVGFMLMTFESVRQYGVSLFASAGVAGLAVGLALRPLLTNLLAGVQLAVTQPIRIDDVVIVENEWGWIEEITSTYVVVRIWDLRRLIVPLTYFIEKSFQNWTREGAALLGSVILYLDYRAPIDAIREMAKTIAETSTGLGSERLHRAGHRCQGVDHRGAHPCQRSDRRRGLEPALRGAREDHRLSAARASGSAASPPAGKHRRSRPYRPRARLAAAASRKRRIRAPANRRCCPRVDIPAACPVECCHATLDRPFPHHPYRQPAAARRSHPHDVCEGGRRAGRP